MAHELTLILGGIHSLRPSDAYMRSKLIIIGSDNGLSPDRRQAIISTNAGLLSIGPSRTYLSETLIKIQQFQLKKMHMKISSEKWRPSCLGINVLRLEVLQYLMRSWLRLKNAY